MTERLSPAVVGVLLYQAGVTPGSIQTDVALVEVTNLVLRPLGIPLGKVEPDFPAIREALALRVASHSQQSEAA